MIARRSLLIVLNNVLGAFLGFFALRFLARFPAESLGAFAWATSTLGIAALLTGLGFPQAHIKRVSEGTDEAAANGTFFLVKTALTAIFSFVVLGGFWIWKAVLGQGFTDATTEPVFVIAVAFYVLLSFRQIFDTTFQAHRHTARAESVLLVDTLVSLGCLALAWNLYAQSRGGESSAGALVARLADWAGIEGPVDADGGAVLIAAAYLLGRGLSLIYASIQFLVHRYPLGRPSRDLYLKYRSFGLPIAIVSGLSVLYANIDRFFLGYFWDRTNVANFEIALRIANPMLVVALAVGTLLFPTISRLQNRGGQEEIRAQTRRAERYLSMFLVPQLVLALVFTREGINIFNAQYVEQAPILRLLLVFVFLNAIATPARSLLLGTGRPHVLLRLALLNVVVVVGLNLVAIPPWALGLAELGAAGVAVVGSVVSYVYIKHRTRPLVGPDFLPPGLVRQALAGLVLGAGLWGARAWLGPDSFLRFWQLGVVAVVSLGVYGLLLLAVREFRREDWRFLVDLMHPGKMAGYVGGELAPKSKP